MEALDWSRPVIVQCNGKRRHQRRTGPSIRTLLDTAYESWDFQHRVGVRLPLSVRTDVP